MGMCMGYGVIEVRCKAAMRGRHQAGCGVGSGCARANSRDGEQGPAPCSRLHCCQCCTHYPAGRRPTSPCVYLHHFTKHVRRTLSLGCDAASAQVRDTFRARSKIVSTLRRELEAQDFLEVRQCVSHAQRLGCRVDRMALGCGCAAFRRCCVGA